MRPGISALARVLIAALAAAGGSSQLALTARNDAAWHPSVRDHTARTQRTVTISQDTSVNVDTTTGSITITGSDRSDLEIEIVRTAPTTSEIDQLSASIDQGPTTLTVSAVQREGDRNPRLTAAITINAPRATRFTSVRTVDGRIRLTKLTGVIDAKSSNGDLVASELSGTIRLETTLGNLSLDRARLSDGGLIRLRAFQGGVKLQLDSVPPDARVLATTFNGRIRSKIPLDIKDKFGVRFGQTTLGRGEPVISIDVVTGDIEIGVK
jgi:DUF4097 and DUF4098 domain-containing protein YvlB